MANLSQEIIEQVVDACKAGAGDAGGSLSSALDNAMQIVDVVAGEPLAASALPEELAGPGLAVALHVGEEAIALLLPEATNLLPPWYTQPDPTGESKLQTLAQELSMLLLPDNLEVGEFAAGAVNNLADALQSAAIAESAACIQLSMSGDDGNGNFYMCWPVASPKALLPEPETPATTASEPDAAPATTPVAAAADGDCEADLESLPTYSRSLLNIRVPVVVKLASTKMAVEDVVNLGPGAIIQFDKSCEDSLDLEAGGNVLAAGDAVKVGDKFGLRITSIRLPDERYQTVGK